METIRKILTRQEVKNILRIKADSSLQDMINAGKFPKGFKSVCVVLAGMKMKCWPG